MSKVVGLWGQLPPPIPGEVSQDVVKMLSDLLERAQGGQINGVAVAMHFSDETTNQCYSGTHSYSTIGRLHALQDLILEEMRK